LRGMQRLESLGISHTKVSSLEPLVHLRGLRNLYCYNTNISEEDIERFKKEQPKCKVVTEDF
jgi:Leucine-rich repeat (LRR) protein